MMKSHARQREGKKWRGRAAVNRKWTRHEKSVIPRVRRREQEHLGWLGDVLGKLCYRANGLLEAEHVRADALV